MTPVVLSCVCSQVSNMHGRLGNARKPERQVTRMVVVMIVAFMVAWTPYAAFSIVVTALPSIHLDPRLAAVPAFFSKTAAVYNPIIYVFMNKQVTFTFMHVSSDAFIHSDLQCIQCKHCLGTVFSSIFSLYQSIWAIKYCLSKYNSQKYDSLWCLINCSVSKY